MNIANFRIGQRLALAFGFLVILMIVLTAVGIHDVNEIGVPTGSAAGRMHVTAASRTGALGQQETLA